MGPGRVAAIAAVVLPVVIAGTFIAAANLKFEAAAAKWGRTHYDFEITADGFFAQLGQRLDLSTAFWQGEAYISEIEKPGVFSWSNQFVALIPRIFWRDKPIIDYGQRVTSDIYGLPEIKSSSTISTIGDINMNSGPYGVLIIGIVVGIACIFIEQRIRGGRSGPFGYIGLAIFVTGLFQHEAPMGNILAGGLQALVVLFLFWRAAVIMSGRWSMRPIASPLRPSRPDQEVLT
jgi:hypothetical protein